MPAALRLRDLIRREERQYAWQIVLAALVGILGALGNLVFRTAIEAAAGMAHGEVATRPKIAAPRASSALSASRQGMVGVEVRVPGM